MASAGTVCRAWIHASAAGEYVPVERPRRRLLAQLLALQECRGAASRKRYARTAAKPPVEHKPCSRCGEEKLADEFYPDKRHVSGLVSWCKVCASPL